MFEHVTQKVASTASTVIISKPLIGSDTALSLNDIMLVL